MMMRMNEICDIDLLEEHCIFFADYAAYMLGCGATCHRIMKNIKRMMVTVSEYAEVTILPAHVIVTVTSEYGHSFSHSRCIVHIPIDFSLNTRLSKLSWDVAESKVSLNDARKVFDSILVSERFNTRIVLLCVSAANAAFCRLFGGDFFATVIVAVATMAGYAFKNQLMSRGINYRIIVLISAFVSAIIGAGGYVWNFSSTPGVALSTSVLYLIPGIPYINSISDLLTDHYLCAFSRFINALLVTICITISLTVAFLLMKISVF